MRLRLVAIRLGARDRDLDVGRVDPRDEVARRDAIPFGDLHLEQPPADFGGDADFGRLDVAGWRGPSARGRLAVARRGRARHNTRTPGTT